MTVLNECFSLDKDDRNEFNRKGWRMTVESIGDLLWDSQLEYYQFDMLAGITLDIARSTPGHNV